MPNFSWKMGTFVLSWLKILFGKRRKRPKHPERNPLYHHPSFEQLEDRRMLSINATQYRYDAVSSGLNASEVALTPANVVAGTFAKQFTRAVDGQVLAQPLYMSALNITTGSGGTHNVAFVATEHDSLYAIDADSGQILWQDAFAANYTGVTVATVSSGDINSGDISPEIGITGTPAIDATNGFLYVVAKTKEIHNGDTSNPHFVNTLYRVNVHDGTSTSLVIADTTHNSDGSYTFNSGPYVLGTGDGSINVGGQNRVYFNSMRQMFRPGVSLVNGQVILGSASHGDNGPYHGWMLTYNASTLALTGVLCTSPNSGLSGIWQGGDSIVSDPQGYFYFETGNGSFNQNSSNFDTNGFPIDGNYGDSFLKVGIDAVHNSPTNQNVNGWGLKVVDYFTPYNQASLNSGDTDLGSGGPTVLPDTAGSTAHPHLLVGGGKQGSVYLIDRDNMGKFNSSTDLVVQELANTVGGILSTPAFFNGKLYITSGYGGPIYSFTVSNAQVTASGTTSDSYGNLDGSPVVSANGTANGIVWALERGTGQLRAYSVGSFSNPIYTSAQVTGDQVGSVMKFTSPMVADGHVFVGTGNSLVMYALNTPPTAPPNAPSNLAVTNFSGSLVTLAWSDNSNNESTFLIERSTDGTNYTQIATVGVNQNSYVDASVQAFTAYSYRVRAGNVIGNSAYSNVATVTTQGNPTIGGGDGLLGQYYAGNLIDYSTSTPLLTRVDSSINYDWTSAGPATIVGQSNYQVHWSGELQAQFSEAYTFTTASDDGVRLYINGQLVIDDFTYHGTTTDTSAPIVLQAGKVYSIAMDFYQGTGGAVIQLSWSSAHTPQQIIPQSQLFSGSAPNAPNNLQGTPVSGTQINLTWTTNSTNEEGYEVDRMLGSSGTFVPIAYLPAGSNSYSDTGLMQSTAYTYRVRATNFVANSAYSNQAAVSTSTPPATPSNAHTTAISTTSISLAWQNNANNATAIRVFRNPGGSGTYIFIASLPPTATSYVDNGPSGNGLTPGTRYDYHIQAGNLAGYTDFAGVSVSTIATPPTQLAAVPASGQVTLGWTAPKGAQTFNIYRGTTAGGESSTALASGVSGTTYVDSAVVNGTAYYYKVSAVDSGGESVHSAEASATPVAATFAAPPPTGMSAAPSDRTVTLTWKAAPEAISYNVYRGTASGGEVLVQSGVSGLSFADTGLTNGVTYYYQVTAVNAVGEGIRSSEVSAVPVVVVPQTPINVTATPGDGVVAVSWSASANATSYNIYRSTDAGNEVLYEQSITATSFNDNNVTNGVTYYYQVSAGNGVGESNLSLESSATPLPPLAAVPGSLAAVGLNGSQIRLTWTEASTSITSFTVQRSPDGVTFTTLTTLDGTTVSFTDSNGLVPGITYSYRILATNLAGSSSYSSVATAAALLQVPFPWTDADIGSPALAGSAYYSNGTIFVKGSGNDIWNSSDQFNFVYQSYTGNGTIVAYVGGQTNTDPWAKSGVMFRNSLAANSAWTMMVLTPGNGASFQARDSSGTVSNTQVGGYAAPNWVKLVRSGSTFIGYVSNDGTTWTQAGAIVLNMNASVFIGLCDTSHNTGLISSSSFSQISINGSAVPAAPSSLTASAASGTSVSLAWANNGTASFSNQVYRLNPGGASYALIATLPSAAATFFDTGLTSGSAYSYRVVATNTVGNSTPASASITIPVIPVAVSALQPGTVTTNSIALSWVLNSSNNTGVSVYRRAGGTGSFSFITSLAATATSYVDSGLQPGTLYEYHISAYNAAGLSTAADTGATTLSAVPTGLTATAGVGQVQLNWTASIGAVAYNIYRGLTPGSEGAAPYASVNNVNNYTDTGVVGGQSYYYRITAVNFSGESARTSEVSGVPVAGVVGRYVFYNNSYFDGNNAAGNAADDAAIATDKQALLPGQTATFANYTSNSKGLNGIAIDAAGFANPAALSTADFTFLVGNTSDPTTWTAAPSPTLVLRTGAGVSGSTRIELIWSDGAIQKQWLQVTTLANSRTGLTSADAFYFGNAVGESGNSATDAVVNASDSLGARGHAAAGPVAITNVYDYNRDGALNSGDVVVAQQNGTSAAAGLLLFTAPITMSGGQQLTFGSSATFQAVSSTVTTTSSATPQAVPAPDSAAAVPQIADSATTTSPPIASIVSAPVDAAVSIVAVSAQNQQLPLAPTSSLGLVTQSAVVADSSALVAAKARQNNEISTLVDAVHAESGDMTPADSLLTPLGNPIQSSESVRDLLGYFSPAVISSPETPPDP